MHETNQTILSEKLEAILLAGRMLMESGAETYRIETTLSHMAKALQIGNFESYTTNRGIFVSGNNPYGPSEAKVTTATDIVFNFRKLEDINLLSRRLSTEEHPSAASVINELYAIQNKKDDPTWMNLLAYFIGAGAFAAAIGSSWLDSLASAITGLLIGLIYHYGSRFITTPFLLTMIASTIAVFQVNTLVTIGFGHYRSSILLGAFMVIVPGAFFVNAIREITQNNFIIGLSFLINALLICLAMSAGVATGLELLPATNQISQTFSTTIPDFSGILLRSVAAGLGTIAFAMLYSVRQHFYFDLGLLGGTTWFFYLLLSKFTGNPVMSIFIPGLIVAFASKALAIKRKSPATIFLATSIFPLLPGLGFYQSIYFMMTGSLQLAEGYLRSTLLTAFTITIAIAISQQVSFRKILAKVK